MNQNNKKINYFSVGMVIIILAVVFLGQKGYLNAVSGTVSGVASGYRAKGEKWVSDRFFEPLTDTIQERGENVKEGTQAIKKDSENILQKTENYFSGIANSLAGKNSCQVSE